QHLIYFHVVEVDLLVGKNNTLYIDYIRSKDQGHGLASRTIKEICFYADRHKVKLWLEVKPIPPYDGANPRLNEQQLVQWYARHGFESKMFLHESGKSRTELGGFIDMVREPQTN
ncbi:hypothetical protein, partial [Klebsiella pneumoniae]|uniref:hypothetical protein n=1 Tax=Klebsiella pneumoniae TaxID=573 RepID=UPI003012BD7B